MLSFMNGIARQPKSSSAIALKDIDNLRILLDASDSTTLSQSGGIVSQIDDISGNANNATQAISANRPSIGRYKINPLSAASKQDLPDAQYGSDAGKGFTITGLVWDDGRNAFWAGNFGRANTSAAFETPQILRLSQDGTTIQYAINVSHIMQGVAHDPSVDRLYYTASTNVVYKIETDGTAESVLFDPAIGTINGLAYDSIRGHLWLSSGQDLKRYTKAGALEATLPLDIHASIDHIYHDAANDHLWVSYGSAGGWGFVVVVDASNGAFIKNYQFKDAYAIEGISLIDGMLFVANDGYYHSNDIADVNDRVNQIQVYPTDSVGKDAVLFDGTDNFVEIPDLSYGANTIFIVHLPYTSVGALLMNYGVSGRRFYMRNQAIEIGSTNNALANPVAGKTIIQTVKVSGAAEAISSISVNNGPFQTQAVSRTGISGNVDIGRSAYGGEHYNGLIGLIAVIDRDLSDKECQAVRKILMRKWAM